MFNNGGSLSWSRLERILSGKDTEKPSIIRRAGRFDAQSDEHPSGREDRRSSPSHHPRPSAASIPYADLHAASSYHFLRGAGDPEEMVSAALNLGLNAVALLDRDGFYGAARFATAAAEQGLATVFGAELSVMCTGGPPLTVLCREQEGYRRLSRVITQARLGTGGHRDKSIVIYPDLAELASAAGGHWLILIDHNWLGAGSAGLSEGIRHIIEAFGAEHCIIELQFTMSPVDTDRNAALHGIALSFGLREIITTAATCPTPATSRIAGAKAALSRRLDVTAAAPGTHPLGGSWLHSGEEMFAMAGDCQWLRAAVTSSAQIAAECAFGLNLIAPQMPDFPVADGYTAMTWVRELARLGAEERYGLRSENCKAWGTIDHELEIIEKLGFPGYFLIVHDIVSFCRREDIFCQGRGSAVNSAVCYALGITNVDAVKADLLFERFLSPERDGPPDIDLDIESTRREEVIQYLYRRYGRDNAAQVANVITYRKRGALRDAARALGYAPGRVDAWAQKIEDPPENVRELAAGLIGQPRHLSIHSGGMVICDRPIADVVPVEWARKTDRSVVQWDKDDCAAVGLVKFDVLGLGMLEALHHAVDLIEESTGKRIELWQIPPDDPEVYAMLSRADAVGVFQVESRAQLATLPRLKPACFYDLVVEVSLIRPGPIQGGSVHPYIRRHQGEEEITFDHPCLEPVLTRTLGIPLFQEQLMQIAVAAAGFTPAEADALRRAMGSKRSPRKMELMHARFCDGARELHGMSATIAERIWKKVMAFAEYGFPESHAQSFASLVYFSAWFKYHYPAEFCVALLRAQPMGFYSPQSLIADARRHGVRILPIDVNHSEVQPTVEDGGVRPGLTFVKGIGKKVAERLVNARNATPQGFSIITDLSRDAGLSVEQVEALARAGACDSLGLSRRQAVWVAGQAATERAGMLPGTSASSAPPLPGMNAFELAVAGIASTGITTDGHPIRLLREALDAWPGRFPVVPAASLLDIEDGRRILVAGVVTHRQRPATAGGVTFLGMEDETGLINVMVSAGLWQARRRTAGLARIMMVRGIVDNANGAAMLRADRLEAFDAAQALAGRSRDFK